jgi:hypothetical protein
MQRGEYELIRHFAPDPAACVRALLLLVADDAPAGFVSRISDSQTPPAQAERHPSPARVADGAHQPAKQKSPARHSVARRRARAKVARHEQP